MAVNSKSIENDWPFDQPKNCAVITSRQIIEQEVPIQVVYHDLEDGGWQFFSNVAFSMDDAKIVGLEEITKIDSTVFEVAKMEPGYHATREIVGDHWVIHKTSLEEAE